MTAPNAEAPSKGTRATPCFLGNESHCDACRQAAANAARTACKGTLFPVTSLHVTGGGRGHEEDRAPRIGRSMAWCLEVRARSYPLLWGVIEPQDMGFLTPGPPILIPSTGELARVCFASGWDGLPLSYWHPLPFVLIVNNLQLKVFYLVNEANLSSNTPPWKPCWAPPHPLFPNIR